MGIHDVTVHDVRVDEVRVGIVCQNFPPATSEGGISHYSELLANHIAARGHELWAITSTEYSRPGAGNVASYGIRTTGIRGPWNHVSVREIAGLAGTNNLDSVILQYSPASFKQSFRVAWALHPFPCRKITAFHTLWGNYADRIVAVLLLAGSTQVIATNSEIMTLLERYLPSFLRKTCWIPIGSNILSATCHSEGNSSSDKLFFSYFGMLYPGKGMDLLLDVLEALRDGGHHFKFKFIGGGGEGHFRYERRLRMQIERRNLAGTAEHLGFLPAEEVSREISNSRFIFLPYEGGLSDRRGSFMAALAHGKAILTSPPAVEMPFMKNGLNALWPRKVSVAAYTGLIQMLLHDNDLINRLEIGAKELSRHFTWERIATEHELALTQKHI